MACQITGVSIICTAVCSGSYKRKLQNYVSLAFVRRIHRWPVNSSHKGPVKPKWFPFDDVIMARHKTYLYRDNSRFDLCNQQLPTYDHRKSQLWHDYVKITSWRHIFYDQMDMPCALKYGHVMLNKFPSLAPGGTKMATKEENHWHRKCPNVAPPCALGDKKIHENDFSVSLYPQGKDQTFRS